MAGRIQLDTKGPQDKYFTDDPEFTYFIKNFKTHGNFSRFHTDLDFDGELDFGQEIRCVVPQNQGDLLQTASVRVELNPLDQTSPSGYSYISYNESIGHVMIEHADLYIGGTLIQRVTSDFLTIHSENYTTQTHQRSLSNLIGKPYTEFSTYSVANDFTINGHLTTNSTKVTKYFVDIPFYFYKNPELAIPLYAIRNQEVEIVIKLRDVKDCVYGIKTSPPSASGIYYLGEEYKNLIKSIKLNVEMVSVKDKKFPKRVDYVITQLQEQSFDIGENDTEITDRLSFQNPVKELMFIVQRHNEREVGTKNFVTPLDYDSSVDKVIDGSGFVFTNYENLKSISLTLDGQDVLTDITGDLINLRSIQSGIHHSRTQLLRRFYTYSFALEPENHESTGYINFSHIKDQLIKAKLFGTGKRQLRVYALSNNILRVENGTASLLFNS
jgi:hypothetical protein